MGNAPAGGRAPKPRAKACENSTYDYPASANGEIKNRILVAKVDMVAA